MTSTDTDMIEFLRGRLAIAQAGLLRALDFETASPGGIAIKNDVRLALRESGYVGALGSTNSGPTVQQVVDRVRGRDGNAAEFVLWSGSALAWLKNNCGGLTQNASEAQVYPLQEARVAVLAQPTVIMIPRDRALALDANFPKAAASPPVSPGMGDAKPVLCYAWINGLGFAERGGSYCTGTLSAIKMIKGDHAHMQIMRWCDSVHLIPIDDPRLEPLQRTHFPTIEDAEAIVAEILAERAPESDALGDMPVLGMTPGGLRVLQERTRQIEGEGYSAKHDDAHGARKIADAAVAYALTTDSLHADDRPGLRNMQAGLLWPWEAGSFKPRSDIENLTRAGALIIAALDVALRAEKAKGKADGAD